MGLRQAPQGQGGYPAGELGVDLHVMVTAAGYVEHVGSVMSGEVNRLFDKLSGLVGTNWDSPAAGAFRTAQQQWLSAHESLSKALDEIAGGLRDTSTRYDQAERDTVSGITRAVRDLNY